MGVARQDGPEILELGPVGHAGEDRERTSPPWLTLVSALMVGVLLGALGMRWWNDQEQRAQADRNVDVRVSLGVGAGLNEQNPKGAVVALLACFHAVEFIFRRGA